MEENKRELEKDLIEIESAIKSNEARDNTFTVTVLQRAEMRLKALLEIVPEITEVAKQEDSPIYSGDKEIDYFVRLSAVIKIIKKYVKIDF